MIEIDKIAILTPTYVDHFCYIDKLLASYDKYVMDKKCVKFYFVVSEDETHSLFNIIKKYNIVDYEILRVEDLFSKHELVADSKKALSLYDKYTYQSFKKICAFFEIKERAVLILDSESMFIKQVNVCDLARDYFKSPYILYSDTSKRNKSADFFQALVETHAKLLDIPNFWFLEQVNWFFDKEIILDIVKNFGGCQKINKRVVEIARNYPSCDRHLFEGLLYYGYIYKNNEKYGYKVIDVDFVLGKYLNGNKKEYDDLFFRKFKGQAGKIEFAMNLLNRKNYRKISDMYSSIGEKIIRCESSSFKNYWLQEYIINHCDVKILACSQNHLFGINRGGVWRNLIINERRVNKYIHNINNCFGFFRTILISIYSLFAIILLYIFAPIKYFVFILYKWIKY